MKPGETEPIAASFVRFADEARGSSPLYAALSPAIARDRDLLELLLVAPPTQRRPNLLFAAVHDLLLSGHDPAVARYYPSVTEAPRAPDGTTFPAFRDFCLSRRTLLAGVIGVRRTQTNEVRRSIAFFPVLQQLSARAPIALLEVGASAGLNLLVDRYRYRYGEGPWVGRRDSKVTIACERRGTTPKVSSHAPHIAFRIGLDSHPLDAGDPDDARWLTACVWPEHVSRLRLLRAALEVARDDPPRIVAGDAVRSLEEVVEEVPDDLNLCLFHSATLPYLTETDRAAFVSTVDRIGSRRRLHWLSLEGSARQTFGAELPFGRLYTPRPDDHPTDIFGLLGHAHWMKGRREDRLLARVDMHGRWIEWLASSPRGVGL